MVPTVGPMWKRITSAQRSQQSDTRDLRHCSRPSLAAAVQGTCKSMLDNVTQIRLGGWPTMVLRHLVPLPVHRVPAEQHSGIRVVTQCMECT